MKTLILFSLVSVFLTSAAFAATGPTKVDCAALSGKRTNSSVPAAGQIPASTTKPQGTAL